MKAARTQRRSLLCAGSVNTRISLRPRGSGYGSVPRADADAHSRCPERQDPVGKPMSIEGDPDALFTRWTC